jgi:hypothetical protein
MHCVGTDQLNVRFRSIMGKMAKTIGVRSYGAGGEEMAPLSL